MFTYLDAMRKPMKHTVNTLTIGRTENLIAASNDALELLLSSIRIPIKDLSAIFGLSNVGTKKNSMSFWLQDQHLCFAALERKGYL